MRALASLLCFVVGALAIIRAFLLSTRLSSQRVRVPTQREFWTGWIPGDFTPEGQRLRARITRLFLLSLAMLVVGLLLSL